MVNAVIHAARTLEIIRNELMCMGCCDYKIEEVLEFLLKSHNIGNVFVEAMRAMMPYTFKQLSHDDIAYMHEKLGEIAAELWPQLTRLVEQMKAANPHISGVVFGYKSIAGTMLIIEAHYVQNTVGEGNL